MPRLSFPYKKTQFKLLKTLHSYGQIESSLQEDTVQASRNLAYSLIESSTQDGTAQVSQNPAYGQVETFAQDYESTIYEVVA